MKLGKVKGKPLFLLKGKARKRKAKGTKRKKNEIQKTYIKTHLH